MDAVPRLSLLGHRAGQKGFIHVKQVKRVGAAGNGRFELTRQEVFDIKVARGQQIILLILLILLIPLIPLIPLILLILLILLVELMGY